MKGRIALKKVFAAAGTLLLATGGTQAQQPPTTGTTQNIVVQEIKKTPAAQIMERPAGAPAMVFDAPPAPARDDGGGLSVGIGFYFIRPYWQTNQAFTQSTTTFDKNFNPTSTSQTQDFSYDLKLAPRIFAGYVGESGLGGRVSWWRYDQNVTASAVHGPDDFPAPQTTIFAPGIRSDSFFDPKERDALTLRNHLVVDVWDFDITKRLTRNDLWNVTGGAGIRYTYLSQYYDALQIQTGLPANQADNRAFHSRNLFNGAGPDVLVEAKRYLGRGAFALYGNARAGVLFGTGRQTTASVASFNVIFEGGMETDFTQNNHNAPLPFLETEFGIEWQGGGRSAIQPFIRIGIAGQSWFGAGSAISGSGRGPLAGTGTANASSIGSNLGFFGGTVMAGINY
jgi:hypothetical protein